MANIIVIDDENEILTLIERFLVRDNKHTVKTFSNPNSALSAIDNKCDLILLDIMMPQINGLELLPKILDKNPQVKVIMMTAYSTLDKVLESHRKGAIDYIMKPFDSLNNLEKKISEVLKS